MSTFQFRTLVHNGHIGAALCKLQQQLLADISMGHLSAAETHSDFAAVAVFQELLCIAHLDIEVIHVNAGGHPDFLDLHHALVLAGLFLSLGLLEAELAVIHNAADGGLSGGGDLDQIEAALVGFCLSGSDVNDTQLCAVAVDKSDFFV